MNDAEKLFSLDELIDYLGISREGILNYVKYLGLPVVIIDGTMQFQKIEVDKWRADVEARWFQKVKIDCLNTFSSIQVTETKDKHGNTILTGKNRIQIIYEEMHDLVSVILKRKLLLNYDQKVSTELVDQLTYIAVIEYLSIWLENDKTARQNISAFLTYNKRYLSHDEKQKINSKTAIEPEKTKLTREAAVKLRGLVALQNERIKLAGRKYKRMPYKSHSYKTNYDYITLRFLSLYTKNGGIWDFIDLLFYDQNTNNSENETVRNDISLPKLARAYKNYDALLSEISKMTDERNYVVAWLQLRKFEKAYRFHLFGKIADYMVEHKLDANLPLPKPLMAFFKMYSPNNSDLVQVEHSSAFSLIDDEFIERAYKHRDNEEIMNRVSVYLTEANSVIKDVVALYHKLYPSEERETWSHKDFEAVYKLLKNKYRSERALVPLNLGKYSSANSQIFECVKSLYTNPQNNDQEAWAKARDVLQNKQNK